MNSHNTLICVIGGAGYIGSHMVALLQANGYSVVVIDDLSTGFLTSIPKVLFEQGSILDKEFLADFFTRYNIGAVFHFASSIQVGESVSNPRKYYKNNLIGTISLLDQMVESKVSKLIFSSTAAIFGSPDYTPIDELHPRRPLSPYGRSKLFVEEILADYETAYNLRSVSLRYFNAAGASPCGQLGERHFPETHLIPLLLQCAANRSPSFSIFGNDYDTADGTCVRDYIHVEDLCRAHLLSLSYLDKDNPSAAFNLGTGVGHSVSEVVSAVEDVTRSKLNIQIKPRRPGDPASLVADGKKANLALGWMPTRVDLKEIIAHAWAWEQKHPWI
ncbi:UDP-glucose 4-epimerase GalE [Pseudomonas lutea]|uniref:UDP-glucose 4-epimerase n=1 Tax=Pseudomonas lutea TaxID=243924 RepID=A0ABR9AGC3_9PSED|nr:UDP-glucose 4-epimerase GalE [Pseudomonas lutea]MBD8124353.1 UDP-glucose 4-epimerase GalE [Pseudomonas lutea]